MDELFVGVVILIVIGCVFWLCFPYFLDKFKRDYPNRNKDDPNDKKFN